MSKEKKFDVLEEVEKQYEESMNEDCQHCGINDPRQSNRYCEACGRIDPDTGKWYWYGTEGSEIDLIQDDPAALAAEMEHQTELHIENLFEERKKVLA